MGEVNKTNDRIVNAYCIIIFKNQIVIENARKNKLGMGGEGRKLRYKIKDNAGFVSTDGKK